MQSHRRYIWLITLLVVIWSSFIASAQQATLFTEADLIGQWQSPECETLPQADGTNGYRERVFTITDTTWQIEATIFGDVTCSEAARLFTFTLGGAYILGSPVEDLPNTREAIFATTDNTLTAYIPDLAEAFEEATCGTAEWTVGESQNISETGCAVVMLPSSNECYAEFDLVNLEEGRLDFGNRAEAMAKEGGMCVEANRPTTLAGFPVEWVSPSS